MATKKKAEAKTDNSNQPWMSNYPPLKEWLDKHDARCMWQLPMQADWREREMEYPSAYVEAWMVRSTGKMFIVVIHAQRHGWEIYTPGDSNRIDATLEDAEKRVIVATNKVAD